jgi:hypothetical protein
VVEAMTVDGIDAMDSADAVVARDAPDVFDGAPADGMSDAVDATQEPGR